MEDIRQTPSYDMNPFEVLFAENESEKEDERTDVTPETGGEGSHDEANSMGSETDDNLPEEPEVQRVVETVKDMSSTGEMDNEKYTTLETIPNKKSKTYARKSKSSSKKSNKRKNTPKSRVQVSRIEETNSHVQGSLVDTEANSSKDDQGFEDQEDGDAGEDASKESEYETEVAVVTCDELIEESEEEDISV